MATALLAVTVVHLMFAPPFASAAAEPESTVPTISAEEVAQYQSDFGDDKAVAEENLDLQHRAAGIVEHLRAALQQDYAGVWFDNAAGTFVVPSHGVASAEIRRVMSDEGVAGNYRTEPVAHSWKDLVAVQAQIEIALQDLFDEDLLLVGLDVRRNMAEVRLASAAKPADVKRVEGVVADAGDAARVDKVSSDDLASTNKSCDGLLRACGIPLRAGVGIGFGGSTYEPICTSAFKALGNVYGNRFLLTAGHCTEVGQVGKTQNTDAQELWSVGPTEESQIAPGDWAKLNANGSKWDVASWPTVLVYWGTENAYAINGESASYVGQYVCRSGMQVALSCGTVEYLNVSSNTITGEHREHQTMYGPTCINEGDSGGPIFANHVALGIVSAEVKPQKPCGQQFVLYSEITEAADAMGVSVGPRLGTVPSAETGGAALGSQPHTVKFFGTVAPHAIQTNFHFNFGTSQPFNRSTLWGNAGTGWGRGPVELVGEQLKGNTTYEYQLVAQNSAGTAESWNESFNTPDWRPAISYQSTTSRTTSSATLNAKINPQGEATTYRFEWGETTSYGNSGPVPDASVGSGTTDIAVSRGLNGLKPETTYHFRVVAKNGEGTKVGPDATFTTMANSSVYTSSFGATGTGSGQLGRPLGMAADAPGGIPSGDVWVVDWKNNRVQKFNSKGEYLGQFGSFGTGNGQFNEPRAITVDSEGNLWVADAGNNRVQKFNSKGEYLTEIDSESVLGVPSLDIPNGIAIGRKGHIFVANQGGGGSIVELYTGPEGSFGSYVANLFFATTAPANMASDEQGDVWVVDQGENKLYEIPGSGGAPVARFGTTGAAPGQLSGPYAVAVKPSGTLLVSDRGNNRIQQFSQSGELLGSFGKGGGEAGQFCEPTGIALSSRGVIFVADRCHDKVQRWNQQSAPEAVTQLVSGITTNGATLNARINPSGLATTYRFEYGKTTAYGSSIPASPGSLAASLQDSGIAVPLSGLANETVYHRRIAATNAEGTTYGLDRAFLTGPGVPSWASNFGVTGSGDGQFNRPLAIAADAPGGVPSGNVWVVDKLNNRVEKFNSKGEYLSKFGSFGTGDGQFNEPRAITVDSEGNLWVADAGNNRVEKFNSKGEYLTKVLGQSGGIKFMDIPSGIAIGRQGHLFVANQGSGGSIVELNPGQAVTPYVDSSSLTTTPSNMAADPQGNVWVVDTAENKVYEMPVSDGDPVARFGTTGSGPGQLSAPFAVAVKASGELLVSDRGNNRIQQFTPAGVYRQQFGAAGSGAGLFSEPSGLAIGPDGSAYVADAGNNRVQRWTFK